MIPKLLIESRACVFLSTRRCDLMGLFSRKKEGDEGEELPPLRFPEMGRERRLPRYESEISPAEASSIKEAVQPGLEIPIRKPRQYRPLPAVPEERPLPMDEPQEMPLAEMRESPSHLAQGRSMFVKVERYREALHKMNHLKDKLAEAEKILRRLDDLKKE